MGCSEIDFESLDTIEALGSQTEEFIYGEGQLDVLIVVDNSRSMSEEQEKMGKNMKNFLSHLEGLDWRVGIVTTDEHSLSYGGGVLLPIEKNLSNGSKIRFIHPKTENYEEKFLNTIQREEWGSSQEKPFKAIKLAFEKSANENQGFFRENANLAIVILSDEDDHSYKVSAHDILSAFKEFISKHKTLSVHGVIVEPEDIYCQLEQAGGSYRTWFSADKIHDFILETGGLSISICNKDYSSGLSRLGERTRRLVNSFRLSEVPIKDSVHVRVLPRQGEVKFSVKGNLVLIESSLQPNSNVYISYDPK